LANSRSALMAAKPSQANFRATLRSTSLRCAGTPVARLQTVACATSRLSPVG